MTEIQQIPDLDIKIQGANIREIYLPETREWLIDPPVAVPPTVPVTNEIGSPVVNMPGCVQAHESKNKSKTIIEDDPDGVMVLCDAGTPSFQSMDYEPEGMVYEYEAPVPAYKAPPKEDINTDTNIDTKVPDVTPCPAPGQPRVGDLTKSGEEIVVGHKLVNGKCVVLYEESNFAEQYLPEVGTVTTTAVIATVAATSALFAKPIADLLLKVVKPAVKKVVGLVQKKVLGKETPRLSVEQRRLGQRESSRAKKELKRLLQK